MSSIRIVQLALAAAASTALLAQAQQPISRGGGAPAHVAAPMAPHAAGPPPGAVHGAGPIAPPSNPRPPPSSMAPPASSMAPPASSVAPPASSMARPSAPPAQSWSAPPANVSRPSEHLSGTGAVHPAAPIPNVSSGSRPSGHDFGYGQGGSHGYGGHGYAGHGYAGHGYAGHGYYGHGRWAYPGAGAPYGFPYSYYGYGGGGPYAYPYGFYGGYFGTYSAPSDDDLEGFEEPVSPYTSTRYYCRSADAYYPDIQTCPEGWEVVGVEPSQP